MGKFTHAVALLGLVALGIGEPDVVITKTVGGAVKPVASTVTVRSGLNFTLNCKIVDSNDPTLINDAVVWSRKTNDSRLHGKKMLKQHSLRNIDTAEPSTLKFSPVTAQDRGTYICSSLAHHQSKSVYLIVKSSKVINQENNDADPLPTIDDYKMLTDLLHSLDREGASSTTNPEVDEEIVRELLKSPGKHDADESATLMPFSFSNAHNIDWSRLSEVDDKWPSQSDWVLPDVHALPQWDYNRNLTFPALIPLDNDLISKMDDSALHIPPSSNYEYRNSFRHIYYTVPVSIILVLVGIVRLCYLVGRKTEGGWQRLTTPRAACTHRICVHRRTNNPSAGCFLEGRGAGRLSVLIIHRITAIAAANERANNQAQDDAPPSYDDSTRNVEEGGASDAQDGANDLPPSYNDVLANMSSNTTGNLQDVADSAVVAHSDVLPTPHVGSIQQRA